MNSIPKTQGVKTRLSVIMYTTSHTWNLYYSDQFHIESSTVLNQRLRKFLHDSITYTKKPALFFSPRGFRAWYDILILILIV